MSLKPTITDLILDLEDWKEAQLDTRYLIKAGVTGGQTAIGGTAITDILKLQGTSGNGTLTSPAIQALVGNNGATTALTILNNGNVGIGTTSRNSKLEIGNNTDTNKLTITSNNSSSVVFNDQGGSARVWEVGTSANALRFYDSTSDVTPITIEANATNNMLYLRNSGNVGIGTAGPRESLDITNNNKYQLMLQRSTSTAGEGALIRFSNSAISTIYSSYIGSVRTDSGRGNLVFGTNNGNPGADEIEERMRIVSSGNVGI
ncbi:MAG: hypothetical protein PHQ43_14185, partial [Dehalococcoidales bacterium]|nr:hypothetical protein [Dehalococcoidales bacterium]